MSSPGDRRHGIGDAQSTLDDAVCNFSDARCTAIVSWFKERPWATRVCKSGMVCIVSMRLREYPFA